MKADNFELIKDFCGRENLLDNEDLFLFGQIIIRSKDESPFSRSSTRIVKDLVFRSVEDFERNKDLVAAICEKLKARAYVNINPRSFKAIAIDQAGLLLDYIRKGGEGASRRAFAAACGRNKGTGGRWVVDVDEKDDLGRAKELIPSIDLVVPTAGGFHLITRGFDLRPFREGLPHVEIHKNNPTLLYA